MRAGLDDDIIDLLARTNAVTAFLGTEDGTNLLTAYRRAANILRIEGRKDGPHEGPTDPALSREPAEQGLEFALSRLSQIDQQLVQEDYAGAMTAMAGLRAPLDAFFTDVTVNAPEPETRRNRLRLLNQVRTTMDRVADFSRIEG